MDTMERRIRETFKFDGETLEVTEQKGCNGCHFDNTDCTRFWNTRGLCGDRRSDGKSVIFKRVDKTKETPLVSDRVYIVVDQDGDLINCWKNKEDAEKYAEVLRTEHGTYYEATEQPLF